MAGNRRKAVKYLDSLLVVAVITVAVIIVVMIVFEVSAFTDIEERVQYPDKTETESFISACHRMRGEVTIRPPSEITPESVSVLVCRL